MGFGAERDQGSHPTTPLEVQQYIGKVLRRKRALLDEAHRADLDAREKRREADKAEARAWLTATGSNKELREASVNLDPVVDRMRGEADVAEALVRHLRNMIVHCGDELDGARTAAATIRKEFEVLGLTHHEGA
jgi:hypothetical protein